MFDTQSGIDIRGQLRFAFSRVLECTHATAKQRLPHIATQA
jgi:hypothetical protein